MIERLSIRLSWTDAAVIAAIGLYTLSALNCAWVCDDAYITFRTVDNVLNGYGLRWNVAERVQSYTHPLWMLLHIPIAALFGNVFYGTVTLSIVLSVGSVAVLCLWISNHWLKSVALALTCAASKAFVEYSTSGLENPLSYFLLGLFYLRLLKSDSEPGTVLFLIAGLGVLNRLDTFLLYAPGLYLLVRSGSRLHRLRSVALGFSPVVAWVFFSLLYYGFPLPNTAYAQTDRVRGSAARESPR